MAKRYGPASLNYLSEQIEAVPSRASNMSRRELAFAVLVAMVDDEGAARVLERCLTRRNLDERLALVAATYAPPKLGRRLGLEAMARIAPRNAALEDATVLLRFFGDEEDLKKLESMLDADRPAASKLKSNLVAMRQRLRLPVAERLPWVDDDLAVWRAANYTRDRSASGQQGILVSELGLAARGRIRTGYLRDRLTASSIHSDELFLVLLTVKRQDEASLTSELAGIVSEGREGWQNAAIALMSIGDPAGLKSLRTFLSQATGGPPASDADVALRNLRRQLLAFLTTQRIFDPATPATLDFWTSLSEDPSYPPADRAAFSRVRDFVKDILSKHPNDVR
ncbi:hypothetical protein [Paludisphaera rhizosphaerae]|uniref:hypothetical protein n=1 Tax=Paludisphaera rhizosphaerae TaxID=2711216 RepID=UPI0013ED61F9|nr:hypothetical protein [Paludisphaera rhizosphaerae]